MQEKINSKTLFFYRKYFRKYMYINDKMRIEDTYTTQKIILLIILVLHTDDATYCII